jgi:hypothetical protein
MKGKTIFLLLVAMIILVAIRRRLATYMLEEAIVVIFTVAVAMITILLVLTVFALLYKGTSYGFQWLLAKSRTTRALAQHQWVRPKPLTSKPLASMSARR